MKLALVLYVARYLADNPRRMQRGFKQAMAPIAVVVGPACLLIAVEPDLGTTLVVFFTVVSMLVVAGVPDALPRPDRDASRCWLVGVMFVIAEPYQRARLTSFLHPFAQESGNG